MVRAKLNVRTCTTKRRPFPARGPSGSDGRLLIRQRKRNFRCSLIYKEVPVLRWPGATARYFHFRVPVETGTPPRRRKLHIPRFRLKPKARSFRCSSSPNRTRCAGLRLGTAAPPPFGRKALRLGKIKSWSRTGAPLRAGTEDAYSGKIRPSQAQDSPRRRCPR